MSNISLTFVAHQPNRLIHYDFFKIGEHAFYEDDDLNARVLSTVAERCYFPATRLMKQLIELTGGKFRFGLALSGVILEQALYHRPDLIAAFKDLAETGCVDFLAMPYYNSLLQFLAAMPHSNNPAPQKSYMSNHETHPGAARYLSAIPLPYPSFYL